MPVSPRATLDNPYGPEVRFRTEDVLPPSAYYVNQDDTIAINAITNVAPVTLAVTLRMLTPEGEIKIYQYSPVLFINSVIQTVVRIPPMEGYILGATIYTNAAGLGQCFVLLYIIRGGVSDSFLGGQALLQGYVAPNVVLNYPPAVLEPMFSGPGMLNTAKVSPAVGANFVFTVPDGVRWIVRCIHAEILTDGTVGNRLPALRVLDPLGNLISFVQAAAPTPASTVMEYSWAAAYPWQANAVTVLGPLPEYLYLSPGYAVQGDLSAVGPNDRYTYAVLHKQEWVGA